MKDLLPEIKNVEQLSPAEASEIFEQRIQILCRAGVTSPNGTGDDDRRNAAAGLLKNLYPTLCARMTAES